MNHPRQYQSNLICSRRSGQSVSALEPWGAAWMDMAPLVSLSQQWPCKRCRAMLQIYWLNHVINVINDVVVVVVVVVVVSVAVVVIFVTVLAFWCCGGGVNISAVAMWHHLVTEKPSTWHVHQGCLMLWEVKWGTWFPSAVGRRFCEKCWWSRLFFLFFFESLCIFLTYICFNHFFRLHFSIQWWPVLAISYGVFPRLSIVQEEDIPDILVEAYESTHSHITVSSSGWSNFHQRFSKNQPEYGSASVIYGFIQSMFVNEIQWTSLDAGSANSW